MTFKRTKISRYFTLRERKKLNLSELTPQAAQAPAARWSSREIRFMVIFSDFLYLAVAYLSIFMSCAVFWLSPQARQIQTRSESTRQYYTPMNSLLGYLWSNCFFFPLSLSKLIEKHSVRSRPVKQVFFTVHNNQLYTCAIYIFLRY